jgi:hypothetical protein
MHPVERSDQDDWQKYAQHEQRAFGRPVMFDDLREMTDGSPIFDESVEKPFKVEETPYTGSYFLGLSPGQRFIIALLLLGTVIVMGLMCLMVTERVMIF